MNIQVGDIVNHIGFFYGPYEVSEVGEDYIRIINGNLLTKVSFDSYSLDGFVNLSRQEKKKSSSGFGKFVKEKGL